MVPDEDEPAIGQYFITILCKVYLLYKAVIAESRVQSENGKAEEVSFCVVMVNFSVSCNRTVPSATPDARGVPRWRLFLVLRRRGLPALAGAGADVGKA